MPKFQLLLLDAGIVIESYRLGIWEKVVQACRITLSEVVVNESKYWEDDDGGQHTIDLEPYIQSGQIQQVSVVFQEIKAFSKQFDPSYLNRLDDGEAESLAYLMRCSNEGKICSGDHIVYKVLGRLAKGGQGISLEEILQKIGLGQGELDWSFTKRFREKYTHEGEQDHLMGRGLKNE